MRRVRGPVALLSALALAVSAAPADARDIAPPSDLSTAPASPANNNFPLVGGSVDSTATVTVYATADCSGMLAAVGTGEAFATVGRSVNVADNTTTEFSATATATGGTSSCSSPVTYIEDSTPPNTPSDLAVAPKSPANDNSPTVSGSADAGSTVEVFAHDGCTGSLDVTAAADFFALGIAVSVADDSTTTFSVDAMDAAGNRSACATAGTYVEDSTPPPAPANLSSSPASPSQNDMPRIKGSAQDGSTLALYADPACASDAVATGTAAAFASPGLTVTVEPDSTTSLTAQAIDAAGNTSACSDAFNYVEDETAPAAPTGLVLSPASPANDNNPKIEGAAETGSTVKLWATPDCSARMIISGTQAAFASPGLEFSVLDDTTTTVYADATDAAGNTSACSSGVTYVEDSSSPAPSSLAVSPASGANQNTPKISGTAEHGATVRLYMTADCASPVASDSAATFASPGIAINVADNTTTVVYAQATDVLGNVSPCSAGVTYVEDSTPPGAPSGVTVVPAPPANNNAPVVMGAAEAASTVRLFVTSDCSGNAVASGTAAAFGSTGLALIVTDDSTTAVRATATDAAGNVSACSAAATYREDSTAPVVTLSGPAGATTTTTAPAVFTGVAGTAAGDSATVTVSLYTGGAATGTPVTTLTATRDDASGAFSVTTAPLALGTYTARAAQGDSAGNPGVSTAVTFTVAGPPIEPPAPTTPTSPTSPTTPAPPVQPTSPPKPAVLHVSQPSTHLDHGRVRLTLSCRGTSGQTCNGTIRLRSVSPTTTHGNPAFTGTPVRYLVSGGRSKELRFALPAAIGRAIRARGHLTIIVAYGPTGASRKMITVRP